VSRFSTFSVQSLLAYRCSVSKMAHTVLLSLIDPQSGRVAGDKWGETDTRFSYILISCLSLLGRLDALDSAPSGSSAPAASASTSSSSANPGHVDTRTLEASSTSAGSSSAEKTSGASRRDLIVGHIARCRNFDGGFGSDEGSESHGGQGESLIFHVLFPVISSSSTKSKVDTSCSQPQSLFV